jgi:hypothetical protein
MHQREHLVPAGKILQRLMRDFDFTLIRSSMGGWLPPKFEYSEFWTWVMEQPVSNKMPLCRHAPFNVPENSMTVHDILRVYAAYAETSNKPSVGSIGEELAMITHGSHRQLFCDPECAFIAEITVNLKTRKASLKLLFYGPRRQQTKRLNISVRIAKRIVFETTFAISCTQAVGSHELPASSNNVMIGDVPENLAATLQCHWM